MALRNAPQSRRPKKVCKTPSCYTGVAGKNDYCLACQLDGKAPLLPMRKDAK